MKKGLTILFVLTILFNNYAQDLDLEFSISFEDPTHVNALTFTRDAQGNIYTTGCFIGELDLDPGQEEILADGSAGGDIFIQKFDPQGQLIWVKTIGGIQSDESAEIVIDSQGDIYVTGYFTGLIDFDPNEGEHIVSSDYSKFFLLKLDTDGNFKWVKIYGSSAWTGNYLGYRLFMTPNNRLIMYGYNQNSFVSQLNIGSGEYEWFKSFSATGSLKWATITCSSNNELLVGGYFTNTFNQIINGQETVIESNGDSDMFLSKIDEYGNVIWLKVMGGTSKEELHNVHYKDGAIFLSGIFHNDLNFEAPESQFDLESPNKNIFLIKMNPEGDVLNSKAVASDETSLYFEDRSITVDNNGAIFLVASFKDTVEIYTEASTLPIEGSFDLILVKLNTNLEYLSTDQLICNETFRSTILDVDQDNNLFLFTAFEGSITTIPNNDDFFLQGDINHGNTILFKFNPSFDSANKNIFTNDITLFPNPTKKDFYIDSKEIFDHILVYDNLGRLVYEKKGLNATKHKVELETNPGIYSVVILSKDKVQQTKIVKL